MSMTLKEQAWQSGLVLLDETAEWNETDWPPLVGGWRSEHASAVLNHPEKDNDTNNKGQTVVVLGGVQRFYVPMNSVLVLNLAESNKQWREGPPMNKTRCEHAAVVCNGSVYVMGGCSERSVLDCIERIDSNDLLQSFFTTSSTHEINWTTLNCRLSTQRLGCCAVAVHDRYIVVMGGRDNMGRAMRSVDIIDTSNHTVVEGPSMNLPRLCYASGVIGHRIFVGCYYKLSSVESLDFSKPRNGADKKEEETDASTVITFASTWSTHSDMVLSETRCFSCAVVAVGSCLVVAGGHPTVEVLDTNRNLLWNLPSLTNHRNGCSMVTVANQVAIIGGEGNSTCSTLSLMDKNTWCFQRLCEQQPEDGRYHQWKGMAIRDATAAMEG